MAYHGIQIDDKIIALLSAILVIVFGVIFNMMIKNTPIIPEIDDLLESKIEIAIGNELTLAKMSRVSVPFFKSHECLSPELIEFLDKNRKWCVVAYNKIKNKAVGCMNGFVIVKNDNTEKFLNGEFGENGLNIEDTAPFEDVKTGSVVYISEILVTGRKGRLRSSTVKKIIYLFLTNLQQSIITNKVEHFTIFVIAYTDKGREFAHDFGLLAEKKLRQHNHNYTAFSKNYEVVPIVNTKKC